MSTRLLRPSIGDTIRWSLLCHCLNLTSFWTSLPQLKTSLHSVHEFQDQQVAERMYARLELFSRHRKPSCFRDHHSSWTGSADLVDLKQISTALSPPLFGIHGTPPFKVMADVKKNWSTTCPRKITVVFVPFDLGRLRVLNRVGFWENKFVNTTWLTLSEFGWPLGVVVNDFGHGR